MHANNLLQEPQDGVKTLPRLVAALGFAAPTEARIKQLFQSERPDKPSYRLVEASEPGIAILLVNYDNPIAVRKKDILLGTSCASSEVVAVSQGPLVAPPPRHIRGMLTASRLTAVLDQIPIATYAQPSSIAETLAQPSVSVLAPAAEASYSGVLAQTEPKAELYRALVVDDSVAIQKSLELKLAGLTQIGGIDFADSGEAALELAEAQHYDLIFLDVMMPGMDGYTACAQLRKKPEYKKTPIIMVSGKNSPLDEVKGVMAGCTTYITKPVQDEAFQKLSIRVLAWLSERKA